MRKLIPAIAICTVMHAAELRRDTLAAWERYIEALHPTAESSFLTPEVRERVRAGEIVVAPAGHNPRRPPNGLIHDWMGAAFLPNSTIDDVLTVVRDYGRYKDFYGPLVIDSKPLSHAGDEYRFRMLMMNQALFSKSALDGEYTESFHRASDTRWYSIAYSTRVQQIDDFGKAGQHALPEDEGSGYLWRIYSISSFEQRDGGVYVDLEVVALSRDIPFSLSWVVEPIVRRISRGSLLTSLEKTRAAVTSRNLAARVRVRDEISWR